MYVLLIPLSIHSVIIIITYSEKWFSLVCGPVLE